MLGLSQSVRHSREWTVRTRSNAPDEQRYDRFRAALNTPENLRKWIQDPSSIKRGALMPAFQLSDPQIDELTAYLETFR